MTDIDLPADLVEAFLDGHAALLIGAGCSRSGGLPDWPGLLSEIQDEFEAKGIIGKADRDCIEGWWNSTDNFPRIAQLFQERDREIYYNTMRDILDPSPAAHTPPQYFRNLPRLGSKRILTTNFDLMLEAALPNWKSIAWANEEEIPYYLKSRDFLIFHIHGRIDFYNTLIHTIREYEILNGPRGHVARNFLRSIFDTHTILTVGYRLGDPFVHWLYNQSMNDWGVAPEWYSLTTDVSREARCREWETRKLHLLSYPYSPQGKDDESRAHEEGLSVWFQCLANKLEGVSERRRQIETGLPIPATDTKISSPSKPPYISDRAVYGDDFLGRDMEIRIITSRLYNRESTLILGPAKSGKSSALQHIQKIHSRDTANANQSICWLDSDAFPAETGFKSFWKEILSAYLQDCRESGIREVLRRTVKSEFTRSSIMRLFRTMSHNNHHLTLLIDRFDRVVNYKLINVGGNPLPLLRSVCANIGSLCLAATSRISIGELNKLHPPTPGSSPYFNHMLTVKLRPFHEEEILELFRRSGDDLTDEDKRFIRRLAGRQPYLLQALASRVCQANGAGKQRQGWAASEFYPVASRYFQVLWDEELDDRSRALMLTWGLLENIAERSGGISLSDYVYKNDLSIELGKLDLLGLIEQLDDDECNDDLRAIWRDRKRRCWGVSARILARWARDVSDASNVAYNTYKEWIARERYTGIVSCGEWRRIIVLRDANQHSNPSG